MEIRCGKCSKLFRVADEKITGAGIKFLCTRCGEYVKIPRQAFEEYQQSQASIPGPPPASERGPGAPPPAGPQSDFVIEPTSFDVGGPSSPEAPAGQQLPGLETTSLSGAEPGADAPPAGIGSRLDLEAPIFSAQQHAEPEADAPFFDSSLDEQLPSPFSPGDSVEGRHALPGMVEGVNPFASGASAGAMGGLGCALPVLAAMLLGSGLLASFSAAVLPQQPADVPLGFVIGKTVAGFLGLGILIGMILAMIRARGKRKMFSFCGIVFSAVLGALIGAGQGLAVSAGSDRVMQAVSIGAGAVWWGIKAFLVAIAVVIIRRTMMSSKDETFVASLSGAQVMGVIIAVALMGAAAYGEVMKTTQIRHTMKGVAEIFSDLTSAEGLRVTNQKGSMDKNKDLVITGVVENTGKKKKPTWYLVADVYDAKGGVLAQARMLNGQQLYSARDHKILLKRGKRIQDIMPSTPGSKTSEIPPKGKVHFKIRVIDPPTGVVNFTVVPRPLDPVRMIKEMTGGSQSSSTKKQ